MRPTTISMVRDGVCGAKKGVGIGIEIEIEIRIGVRIGVRCRALAL